MQLIHLSESKHTMQNPFTHSAQEKVYCTFLEVGLGSLTYWEPLWHQQPNQHLSMWGIMATSFIPDIWFNKLLALVCMILIQLCVVEMEDVPIQMLAFVNLNMQVPIVMRLCVLVFLVLIFVSVQEKANVDDQTTALVKYHFQDQIVNCSTRIIVEMHQQFHINVKPVPLEAST